VGSSRGLSEEIIFHTAAIGTTKDLSLTHFVSVVDVV
jgi:hypothetical protein